MDTIGAFEAKTHLSALLERVSKGETITITRHGVPAAKLVPVQGDVGRLPHAALLEGMRELRKRVKPGAMPVKDMIEEGRRR
ncbi:MAG TPA: type II toxin-antitoxin system prevent-host-death family antitoxin [Nitrospira sp.]|nr:type II toxin-antitoxin system prevent-host-death family antitoxin [Nitrospira sp.]MCW5800755.1 type II toxin-antitoxin system prevent-host-death family antitoxin [Nitrospira sp.]HMU31969.1 type II toxin-antitoxin system prevent-host-death family antitoxin [Nitrospira sp.]HMV59187.1 type II toxin-antitoxin system prevent-host-death family antitoxin [Nitrospira sp.]HMW85060.1 type II toxin-antitoxin system prevent-host-death family antitoxin [Nitrospira sp.]